MLQLRLYLSTSVYKSLIHYLWKWLGLHIRAFNCSGSSSDELTLQLQLLGQFIEQRQLLSDSGRSVDTDDSEMNTHLENIRRALGSRKQWGLSSIVCFVVLPPFDSKHQNALAYRREREQGHLFLTEDWHQSFRPLKIGILGLFSTFVWPILFWY